MTNPPNSANQSPFSVIGGESGRIAQVTYRSKGLLHLQFEDEGQPSTILLLEGETAPGKYQVKIDDGPVSGVFLRWDVLLDGL